MVRCDSRVYYPTDKGWKFEGALEKFLKLLAASVGACLRYHLTIGRGLSARTYPAHATEPIVEWGSAEFCFIAGDE